MMLLRLDAERGLSGEGKGAVAGDQVEVHDLDPEVNRAPRHGLVRALGVSRCENITEGVERG